MEVRDFIGTKYTVHGRTLEEGLDCYGVVLLYYKVFKNITLIDPFYDNISTTEKEKVGNILLDGLPLTKLDKPKKDCIVSIQSGGKLSHIAIYLGQGMILHSTKATGCVISNIQRFTNCINGYYTIKE